MGSKRKVSWPDTAKPLRDICLKYDLDPGEEMIRMCKETITNEDGDKIPMLVAMMGPRDGLKLKADLLKSLHEYMRPKLRNVENHGTQDTYFNITIKQYGALSGGKDKIIEMERPKLKDAEVTDDGN